MMIDYEMLCLSEEQRDEPLEDISEYIVKYNGDDFYILKSNVPPRTLRLLSRIVKEYPDQDCPTDSLFWLLKEYGYKTEQTTIDSLDTMQIRI